jgi:hypothetical protein
MDEPTIKLLAESIARDLFTSRLRPDEVATHLALMSESAVGTRSRYLGGWCESAVATLIARRLRLASALARETEVLHG